MSELDVLVNVNIVATSATPSVPNFGTPAIYGYHTHNTDLIRMYFDTTGMISDGFAATDPLVLMADSILRQNPRPPTFKVIRATTASTMAFTFNVVDHTDGDSVGLSLLDASGNLHDCHHTPSSESASQVATAIATLIAAVPGVSSSSAVGALITTTLTTAGAIFYPSNILGGQYTDTTPLAATHPDADLTAVRGVDDKWYALAIEHGDANNIANVAAWVESNKKIAWLQTTDFAALNDTEGGVTDVLADAGYTRTGVDYTGTPSQYGPLGLTAQRLTADPGSDTWAYKQVNGRTVDVLTPTQTGNLDNENANYYIDPGNGVPVTLFGRAASGLFMDVTRGIDALSADIQVRIFNLLVSNPKVPYTQAGISQIAGQVRSSLKSFVSTGFLSGEAGFQPVVLTPLLADVNPVDKKARVLKGISFTAFATGAVHTVQINGTIQL